MAARYNSVSNPEGKPFYTPGGIMIYHVSNDSSTARTNGSPLPKRHSRRAALGARATLMHCHPYNLRDNLRGGGQPSARRLRSEPTGTASRDKYTRRGNSSVSPKSLSPTATDWNPGQTNSQSKSQSQSLTLVSPSPTTRAAPSMSYAAVAKLGNNKVLLRPLPPPQCPILADPAKNRHNGNNGRNNGRSNGNRMNSNCNRHCNSLIEAALFCRPAASLGNPRSTKAARVKKPGYSTPRTRGNIKRQESDSLEDGGALLIADDMPMPDVSSIDLANMADEIRHPRIESIEIETVEMEPEPNSPSAAPSATPQETSRSPTDIGSPSPFDKIIPSKINYDATTGVDETAPNMFGFYSPIRGAASRLGFDQSPFFPKSQAEYSWVVNNANDETANRSCKRARDIPVPTFSGSPWLARVEEGRLGRTAWDRQSQAMASIRYKELDGPMQRLLDYIDEPET